MDPQADYLVLGSGIAGLSAALELAHSGTVHVVTKRQAHESNTRYAQGGIAAVMASEDSFESHIQDTLRAGAGLCDEDVVRMVVADGPARVRELVRLGVRFSGGGENPDLALEGGHSSRRILHAGDLTGREIERALVETCRADARIRIFEEHAAVDLILERPARETAPERNRCLGAYVLCPDGRVRSFSARAVVLASGGAGKVYLYTSNPDVATGDGMAMAYRAGVPLANLEFVQFHPTCLYNPGGIRDAVEGAPEGGRRFLLSEALRGEGGVLVRRDGSRLMEGVHPSKDLAPRDVVARAIDAEMKRSGAECVFLDITSRKKAFLIERFPTIYAHCLSLGLDMSKDPLPVVPAAHFFCGGVRTDSGGATPMPGLFAVGETACTGLHGANRLASNSLLEGCVFAHRAASRILQEGPGAEPPPPPSWSTGRAVPPSEAVVVRQDWDEVRRLMWNYAGIARTDRRLEGALERLRVIHREVDGYYWDYLLTRDLVELRNISLLAELICASALARKESRGLHFNADHPRSLDSERRDTVVRRGAREGAAL